MSNKVYNSESHNWSMLTGKDLIGSYILYENGTKEYMLTTAITSDVTATTAPYGTFAKTSNATGRGKLFVSDGSKWQTLDSVPPPPMPSMAGAVILSSIYGMRPDWQAGNAESAIINATGNSASNIAIYGTDYEPYGLQWNSITSTVGTNPYASTWLDQSGNGRNFTGTNSLNIANERIDFNGTSSELGSAAVNVSALTKFALVFVGNPNVTTMRSLFGLNAPHNGDNSFGFGVHPSLGIFATVTQAGYVAQNMKNISSFDETARAVWSFTFDMSQSAVNQLIPYYNGSAAGWSNYQTDLITAMPASTHSFRIAYNGTVYTDQSTYMVGVFDGNVNPDVMTAQWHQDLTTWWQHKWA